MASYNKVILMGNVTRDPEVQYTPKGTPVAHFGLAMNRTYGDKEETTFVEITAWDKTAEAVGKYVSKGRLLMIEGRLQEQRWQDKETGANRSKLTVVAERVQFLPKPATNSNGASKSAEPESVAATVDEEVPF